MSSNFKEKILQKVKEESLKYPVTIKKLEKFFECSNSLIHKYVKCLEKSDLIRSKRVITPKGGVVFYKSSDIEWPKHLGLKCIDCQNKSVTCTCIFHDELAEKGIIIDTDRIGIKITENTYACIYFIERKTHWKKKRLEEFLDESRWVTKTGNGFEINYHCLKCGTILPSLGTGWIAKIGSSVLRCGTCNSFYKTLFNEKKEFFYVHYNEEMGMEYKKNFAKIVGDLEIEPEGLYSSESLGIVIHELKDSKFNFRNQILIVNNWVGKLEDINYIVTKKAGDYKKLQEILSSKGYKDINIIQTDELISPPPTKQQIGILRLLRETLIVNIIFCIAMLRSRITVIEWIDELFNRERNLVVKRAVTNIEEIIDEVKKKSWLTAKEWNDFEMRAGKEMWVVIACYLEGLGVKFPGRNNCRLVNDPSKPHRTFFAYSEIDVIINGIFGKGDEFVKRYLNEIEFCWNGLPGICHGKTRGGEFGWHLDMREPEKIIPIPYLMKAIKEKEIVVEDIPYLRGRRREKIYYIQSESELEKQIEDILEEALSGLVNGRRGSSVIRDYYLQGKHWLNNLQRRSNYYEIEHHGVKYQPWVIIQEGVWKLMGDEEKKTVNRRNEKRT